MKTSFQRAVMAIALFTGLHLSAAAGVVAQDNTSAVRPGTRLAAGPGTGMPGLVVPMPAQILPVQLPPTSVPMPGQLPALPSAVDEPAAVPEPGTVVTFGAGLALMVALARRRRPAR